MPALTVSVSGDTPDEVATRLRALADAMDIPRGRPSAPPAGGLPDVPTTSAPKLCSVHHTPLTLDSWTSKAGKQCRAWRCPQSSVDSGCSIEWAS